MDLFNKKVDVNPSTMTNLPNAKDALKTTSEISSGKADFATMAISQLVTLGIDKNINLGVPFASVHFNFYVYGLRDSTHRFRASVCDRIKNQLHDLGYKVYCDNYADDEWVFFVYWGTSNAPIRELYRDLNTVW